jgi:VWFA-related protein
MRLMLVAIALLAQDATFKSETKLVIVDLSVRDKSGRPITNLKKEDIEVLEDGVRQDIRVFELQKLDGEPLAPMSFAYCVSFLGHSTLMSPKQRSDSSAEVGRLAGLA